MRRCASWVSFPLLFATLVAQQPGWQSPPEPIASLVTAAPPPDVSVSPCRRFLLLSHHEALPPLEVVARPHLKLAGSRIDARTRGPQLGTRTLKLLLRTRADGSERELAIPAGHVRGAMFSADGERIALLRATDAGTELWLASTATGAVKKIDGVALNSVLGGSVRWWPDQKSLLCKLALPAELPAAPAAPAGPSIQETAAGVKAPVRTNQDMLQDEYDAACFECLAQSQLARVDADTGAVTRIGEPAAIGTAEPSPDGKYLVVTTVQRPYSYLVPWSSFPQRIDVLTNEGKRVRVVAELPLRDNVPIGGVPKGARGLDWMPTQPHTLTWTEALDDGDPKKLAQFRDSLMTMSEFAAEPQMWVRTAYRLQGIGYGSDGKTTILSEFDRDTRTQHVWLYDCSDLVKAGIEQYARSTQDAYGDPGQPVSETTPQGQTLLRVRQRKLWRSGMGASKDGNRPFLDSWEPGAGNKKRLWQCAEGRFETLVAVLDDDLILIRSESPTEPPNYVEVTLSSGRRKPVTDFRDPAQEFSSKISKELIRYQRQDGVALSGTLYLPPGHKDGDRHPVLVWAYPQEFTQASDAGQVRGAPTRYTRFSGISHLWLLLAGYAVFDDAAMPIVGPVRTANDNFVQQLCWNAEAAVKLLVERGVADRHRIAVGGHSYGAFMTANLLCHTDLFAAGVARSGAYNRTLTPFGFQNEERTYWEAPAVYQAMSPFANADKINEPILLIHGGDDDNQGTWPLQSQRLFAAIKGHGGTARLCMLPHEPHGYRARESTLQCLYETIAWLDQHVKNKRAVPASASGGDR